MKKTKKYFIYSTIIVLFTALFFSCKNDIENAVATITGTSTSDVLDAQAWYNKNRQETFAIGFEKVKSSQKKITAKPDWKHAYSIKYDGYTAVHTPLSSTGKFSFVTPENKQAYEATGDDRYLKTFTQMVVINEKKDNRTYAFLMTLIPDKAYIESTHFAALKSNYRKWQKGYSGYVYYHTIDGRFNNGWKFANGKVIKRVAQVDENGINISMGVRSKVTSATVCNTTQQEIWTMNCSSWATTYEYQGVYQPYTYFSDCGDWSFEGYQYTTECYDDGTGGGGSGSDDTSDGGSSGAGTSTSDGGYTVPYVPYRTDCPPSAETNATTVNNVLSYNDPTYATSNIASSVNTLSGYAGNESIEWCLSVSKENDNYWLDHDGTQMLFTSNSATSVSINTTATTYLIVHCHVGNDLTTPSPLDVICLCKKHNGISPNIYGNVVLAKDGSESVIYVSDPVAFSNFCTSIKNDLTFNQDTNGYFQTGSDYANTYNAVYKQLTDWNYTQSVANSYALSYVLDNFNTGLKISYRPSATDQFKEQETICLNGYYSPSICQ